MKTLKTELGIQKEVNVYDSLLTEKINSIRYKIAEITLSNITETQKDIEVIEKLELANTILFEALKLLK
jgi:hypothetical protein